MKFILFTFFSLSILTVSGQDYFQQKVDYKIDVQLFDKENVLRGFESFEYKNNSPTTLEFIYVHLWPNAYKNQHTALAKQQISQNNKKLLDVSPKDQGYIDSLDFKINGEKVNWELVAEHIDICKIHLKTGLKPGESMTVETPFKVKIPSGKISRLGFVDESYQITQWYPKPAVYDKDGWHQMPYLNQGEFYSEFGSFDVSITLPKNYVVGATGDLQTASEIEFLEKKVSETREKYNNGGFSTLESKYSSPFPPSSDTLKTIRYTQKNVHDFGWFADKRFEVLKGEVALPESKRKVTSWSMFVPHHHELWENSIEYLNDAIYYYSKWNGEYPYNQVTAVDGTISAGGGMEYPNVTVIGNSSNKSELEVVIVHEVGHNWFYGLLGSNERDHAWMDEGLNTLNEIRYMQTKYPDNERMSEMANGIVGKLHFDHLNHHDMADLTYQLAAGFGLDQPIELHSADYASINYGAIVYSKTGLVFTYLKDYLGDELFDAAMQAYYDKWHYKHPQPADIEKVLEEYTGKDLDWLFVDLIQTTKQLDYKIKSVKTGSDETHVKVKNCGQVNGPIRVDALSLGKVRESIWVEPGEKVQEVSFNGVTYDQFIIDHGKQIPENNRNNNYWTKKGLFKRVEPIKFEFLAGDNEPDRWNNFWTPAFGGNVYDQFMLGLLFHNQTIPKNKFEYTLAPLYSFGRSNIAGFANLNYSWVPAKNIKFVQVGVKGRTFGNGLNALSTESITKPTTYYAIQPYLNIDLGKPAAKKNYHHDLSVFATYANETGNGIGNTLNGGMLGYRFAYKKIRQYFNFKVRSDFYDARNQYNGTQSTSTVLNGIIEGTYAFKYLNKKNKSIIFRVFYGQNLYSSGEVSERYGFALGGQNGTQDVHYEQYMFGRNRSYGLWANQRINNHGMFKTTANITGNKSLFAANAMLELPYIPLLVAYADYGLIEYATGYESYYDAGIGLKLASFFSVYFPIIESNSILNTYGSWVDYGDKIRFSLDINDISFRKLLQSVF